MNPSNETPEDAALASDPLLGRAVVTPRLLVRPPCEADRARFAELFCSDAFMIFSSGALPEEAAHRRFEHMLAMCDVVPFA